MIYKLELTQEFKRWLNHLNDREAKRAIVARLARMESGLFGDAKPVGGGLSELRLHIGKGYRVYYKKTGNTVLLVLCGGSKSSQHSDIKAAHDLAREYGQ
ncbi:type II toxin-antitoxin system RelE/ParE family toxin [Polycladidibacter hongkongensis]|uniref:type II toxin-antitoxin system RelE/ParE family toxin n=1 Tax=Polycladidibacter hongkongensis TaxID=1647556 RepID=UPI00082DFCF1|nr:type II toxin-antitoxin system RelE/ParE family toxin [Pseudovibrio hongkongensis]